MLKTYKCVEHVLWYSAYFLLLEWSLFLAEVASKDEVANVFFDFFCSTLCPSATAHIFVDKYNLNSQQSMKQRRTGQYRAGIKKFNFWRNCMASWAVTSNRGKIYVGTMWKFTVWIYWYKTRNSNIKCCFKFIVKNLFLLLLL